jgi:DNA-binding CsgD family transcriptional regulator/DNA-binding XRE family transcriptional regulator
VSSGSLRGRRTRHLTFGPDEVETRSLLLAFGENLRLLRCRAGLSQQVLGDRCFLRHDQISRLERGLAEPSLPLLMVLAHGLGVGVEELTKRLQAPRRRASRAKMLALLAEQPELKTEQIAELLGLPSWYVLQNGRHLRSYRKIGVDRTDLRVGERSTSRLTARERDVLKHLRLGDSNAEIALALGIGVETVRTYVARVLRKVGVPSRQELLGAPISHHCEQEV